MLPTQSQLPHFELMKQIALRSEEYSTQNHETEAFHFISAEFNSGLDSLAQVQWRCEIINKERVMGVNECKEKDTIKGRERYLC